MQFAYPYYKGAVGIMVKSEISSGSGWAWVEPFSTDLWIAIAVTIIGWPAAIYFVEAFSLKPRVKAADIAYGVEEATVRNINICNTNTPIYFLPKSPITFIIIMSFYAYIFI